MAETKPWQRLTAERKFRIFLETRKEDAPVGEILRKYGLTLADLRAIEEAVESSAIAGLKVRAGHRGHPPVTPEEHDRVCRELREKERALAARTVEYTLRKKKRPLGLADRRGRAPVCRAARAAIMSAVQDARAHGVGQTQAAHALGLSPRTLQRWRQAPAPAGPRRGNPRPWNALLPAEHAMIGAGGAARALADHACRALAFLLERQGRAISHVAVWRYLRGQGATGTRGQRRGPGVGPQPDTGFAQHPNPRWCWDITHLRTAAPWQFLSLDVLLDGVSRKVVAWHLAESLDSRAVLTLWDRGLQHEGILERPKHLSPCSLSDRGPQM